MNKDAKARYIAPLCVLLIAGCPGTGSDGPAAAGGGHMGGAISSAGTHAGATAGQTASASGGQGAKGPAAGNGTSGGPGQGGSGGTGKAGSGDATGCANVAIPALCKLCADNTCGAPSCSGGKFTGFVCTDADAGMAGSSADAGSGGVCNLACVRGKHCVAAPTPTCVDDATDAGAGGLKWVQSCGAPVCQADNTPYDDPAIPNCTTEKLGDTCSTEGQRCDGVLSCRATYLCAVEAPRSCPISRARYKRDVSYLDDAERARFHEEITQLRLATYRYKDAPEVPQLGFMIDDVEPSVAVSGDHVNLYGYLSMAVAAIQVQEQRIEALERELARLRAATGRGAGTKPKR